MNALPKSNAIIPSAARGNSRQSIAAGDSRTARAQPATEPNMVPRIVCGRVNLTKAAGKLGFDGCDGVGEVSDASAPVTQAGKRAMRNARFRSRLVNWSRDEGRWIGAEKNDEREKREAGAPSMWNDGWYAKAATAYAAQPMRKRDQVAKQNENTR